MTKKFSIQQLIIEMNLTIDDLPGDLAQLAKLLEKKVPGRGLELTLMLGNTYRSTYIYFHNFDQFERKLRDRLIIEKYSNGVKVPVLARWAVLSERQVWTILGKEPGEGKQRRLF